MLEKKENLNIILEVNNHLVKEEDLSSKQTTSNQVMSRHITNDLINQFETNSNINYKNKLIERAIHWCLVNGFVVVPKYIHSNDLMCVTYLPFTLFPTPFKRTDVNQVMNLQPDINLLVSRIASSTQIIEKSLDNLTKTDRFVSSLWSIYKKSIKEGYNQNINLSILRVDYMLHQAKNNEPLMKQVEINTIAAGFGYVSTKMSSLHREILKWSNFNNTIEKTPFNEPIVKIASGFVEAWRLYKVENSIVLFVVLDWEINIADQRHLEYEIMKQEPKIEIQRCTLIDLYQHSRLDENKKLLFNDQEVSIVYYRAGYAPAHYESDKEWDALLKIEMSKAVKCPSLGTFLAGMKKIQEFISHEQNLIELCNNNKQLSDSFKSVFADFFRLDCEKNFEKVLKNPENYVLKPQREGGGNNYYNNDIKEILTTMLNSSNLQESEIDELYNKERYIVMELLKPVISENYIISPKLQQKLVQANNQLLLNKEKITNELGVYGVLVKNGSEVVLNETCGYCLRSKPAEDNEGGVMCGSGALDSIYFLD